MGLTYHDNTWTINELTKVKPLMESQMVVSDVVKHFIGPDFMSMFETQEVAWLSENSFTDLNKKIGQIGYPIRSVYSNNLKHDFFSMTEWSNPASFGASAFPFRSLDVIIPDSQAVARVNAEGGEEVMFKNITLGFLANKGEDRTRIVNVEDGMTGRGTGVTQYDAGNFYALTEYALMIFHKNQMILWNDLGAGTPNT
jgi:hypothetical protein